MAEHHVWLIGELLDRTDRVSDAALDKMIELSVPGLDERTSIRSQLEAMVGQLELWVAVAAGKPAPEIPPVSIAELRERYAEAGPRFVELVRWIERGNHAGEVFREGTVDHPGIFTYGGLVAHVLTFGAHRRAMAICGFRDAGVFDLAYGDPLLYFTLYG